MLPPPNADRPRQRALPGFDPPARPTDRLFFALFPDDASAARLAQLAQRLRAEHGLTGQPFAAARLHVTLHLLGDYAGGLPRPVVDAACAAAAALALPPLTVAFDRAASFDRQRRNRPFVLRHPLSSDDAGEGAATAEIAQARALAAAMRSVAAAMHAAGLGGPPAAPAAPPGVPHMTLLYDDRRVAEHAVEPVIGWAAHEFVLVHSLLGRGRHVPLARWPLRGG